MKPLIILSLVAFFLGCSVRPGPAFSRLQITEETVSHTRISVQDEGDGWEVFQRVIHDEDIRKILNQMKRVRPARTAVVFPQYKIEFYTSESYESPRVEIFLDSTGEGYFRTKPGSERMFYSIAAFRVLEEIHERPEPSGRDNEYSAALHTHVSP